jgi:hypothetical protein
MTRSSTLLFLVALVLVIALSPARAAEVVYAPNSTVEGRTLGEWSAVWWQSVFATPVYAADGTTIIHPQFDAGLNAGDTLDLNYAHSSPDGRVTFLYGSFFGGNLNRTVTVPAGKPIFVPIINSEWSNPDTAAKPAFTTLPGNFTPEELADFAKAQADTITDASATLDGQPINNLLTHRETAEAFTYTQPAQHSITQTFFNETVPGPEASSADGIYIMLLPLSAGQHTLHFTASSPDNSGTPPLLGAFSADMTYTINVSASAIPLPAAAWTGLLLLPLALLPALRNRVTRA